MIAGGTGIAPLFQLARMLLSPQNEDHTTDVSLLFMNHREEDVLLRNELNQLVEQSDGRFAVTYSLTADIAVAIAVVVPHGRVVIIFVIVIVKERHVDCSTKLTCSLRGCPY